MWLPGHFAVALILSLPLLLLVKEKRMMAIAFVAFFSVFPDFLHLGDLRMISHSLIGLPILLAISFGVLWALFRTRPILMGIGVVAAASHLMADFMLGNVTPFYPISKLSLGPVLGIGFDLPMEIGLMAMALVILAVLVFPSGSIGPVRSYSRTETLSLQLVLVPFVLMAAAEGGYYLLFNFRSSPGFMTGALVIDFLLLFVGFSFLVLYTLDARSKPSIGRGDEKRNWPADLE